MISIIEKVENKKCSSGYKTCTSYNEDKCLECWFIYCLMEGIDFEEKEIMLKIKERY